MTPKSARGRGILRGVGERVDNASDVIVPLLVNASTFHGFHEWPVEEFARRVHDALLSPAIRALTARFPETASDLWVEWAGGKLTTSAYSEDAYSEALERLSSHGLDRLRLSVFPDTKDGDPAVRPAPVFVAFELWRSAATFGDSTRVANSIDVCISHTLLGDLGEARQGEIVGLAKDLWAASQSATGYITVDVGGASWSPYELAITSNPGRALAEAAEYARGYYWGNLLSARHIDALSGLEAVKSAPCDIVESLDGDAEQVYLQLTRDMRQVPLSRLAQLKRFLAPVLAPGKESVEYLDYRPRLLVLSSEGVPEHPPTPIHAERENVSADANAEMGARLIATFKGEDEADDGEPVGPLIVWDEREQDVIEELAWMRHSEAERLAKSKGWEFTEDM